MNKTELFIKKSKNIHGDKYDYSKAEYINTKTKIKIICNKCNIESNENLNNHFRKKNCQNCIYINKCNEYFNKARNIHGDKYDYSKSEYINASTNITIKCNKCNNNFKQIAKNHLKNYGCNPCYNYQCITTKQYIEKAKNIHGEKYDYSEVNYINSITHINLKCNKCNKKYTQNPSTHLKLENCSWCGPKKHMNTELFIKKAKEIYGDKYDYTEVNYINANTHIIIKCNGCNKKYKQVSRSHLQNNEVCEKCYGNNLNLTKFLKRAIEIHGDKYDYSLIKEENIGSRKYINIICKKCKNTFNQQIHKHLSKSGCYYCKFSHGELYIYNFLKNNNIENIEPQKKFKGNVARPYDFYLPNYNLVIEYHGVQHFHHTPFFCKNFFTFLDGVKRDYEKMKFLEKNNIRYFEIHYNHNIEEKCKELLQLL